LPLLVVVLIDAGFDLNAAGEEVGVDKGAEFGGEAEEGGGVMV
jgi:hypothetical protein